MAAPLLKICGLRDPAQAAAVAAMGVNAIGVIGVAGSPRWVAPERRQPIWQAVAQVAPACFGVLVVVNPSDADLPLLAEGGHRVVQLHGEETPQRCAELRTRLQRPLWKALRIRTAADLEAVRAYEPVVDALLLDAWAADARGGTGRSIPVELLEGFAPALPWWLAGGLGPERLGQVLGRLQPFGLDASSGVETAPGVKDLARVAAMVAALSGSAATPAA
ncbi:MAG: phosphoribosylanthranilate isomerase [Cyanobacteriota bacterium]|jgi:phosphoribosylanthranilate isomerase|nr:phosphoribosylanthranilate isomerase [Cyanobacteriota bacterium]